VEVFNLFSLLFTYLSRVQTPSPRCWYVPRKTRWVLGTPT